MESMLNLVSFILIVFGILQIILLFKIWGMTDNVKKLTNKFCQEETIDKPITLQKPYDGTNDHSAPIQIGDCVIRKSDGKEMIVDRIISGRYGCADPDTSTFIAGYNKDEISKKMN